MELAAAEGAPLVAAEAIDPFVPGRGPIAGRPVAAGHSNLTYIVERDGVRYVLRRPPRPPYAPTAQDVLREQRIIGALGRVGVVVPAVVAACADPAAIGAPFYVMEHVAGD